MSRTQDEMQACMKRKKTRVRDKYLGDKYSCHMRQQAAEAAQADKII